MKGKETLHENISQELNVLSSVASYEDIFEHLFDELKLLNVRILRHLRVKQKMERTDNRETKGLFIAEEEVESMLNSFLGIDTSQQDAAEIEGSEIEAFDRISAKISDEISNKLSLKESRILELPLLRLARIFGLTPVEVMIMIMAIAPEIDKRYERIYAYFNDDITKKFPSIGFALDVFYSNAKDKLKAWRYFSQDAPLLYFGLIHLIDNHEELAFTSQRFRLDERIKRFIVGDNGLHANLSGIVNLYYPCGTSEAPSIQNSEKEKITQLIMKRDKGKSVFWLYGKAKEEKKAVVMSVCRTLGLPMLTADIEDILFESDHKSVIKNLFQESALYSAVIFLSSGDRLYTENEKSDFLKAMLLRTINEMSGITFISAEALWMPEDIDESLHWHPFEFKLPSYTERRKIWANKLNNADVSESDIDAISARFNFTEEQIKNAVSYAKIRLNGHKLTIDNIYNACSIQSDQRLGAYSTRVTPKYIWSDIVLLEDKLRQLKEICNYIKNKHIVYYKWGFEKKLALGRGLNMLFSGPSGTGKTMTADIIANELRLNMFKIDLSSVVSKYIGETEKNLNRIFRETSSGNTILFFDEADALFGKRSEVKDAHDRYANIEINYLLQKIEEHEGIVILATNLSKNIDDAFLRRMHFSVEFPFPDEKQRELIWKKIFPQEAPIAEDIDYGFLSEKLKLAGGNIKNIALTSAFYAAEIPTKIGMAHIMLAAKREYQKIGKSFLKTDFEPYYELMEEK